MELRALVLHTMYVIVRPFAGLPRLSNPYRGYTLCGAKMKKEIGEEFGKELMSLINAPGFTFRGKRSEEVVAAHQRWWSVDFASSSPNFNSLTLVPATASTSQSCSKRLSPNSPSDSNELGRTPTTIALGGCSLWIRSSIRSSMSWKLPFDQLWTSMSVQLSHDLRITSADVRSG